MDLRQHLANISTTSAATSQQQQQEISTIQAVQRGLHASAPALARSHMNRHVVPSITASPPTRLSQWQGYRIPQRSRVNVDMDADDDEAILPPPSWVGYYHRIILHQQEQHARLSLHRAASYQAPPRQPESTMPTRSQSEGHAPDAPQDVIMINSSPSHQSSDSEIELHDPDVEVACESDTGEASHS